MTLVGIIDCGISNVGSVRNAFGFLGIDSTLLPTPDGLRDVSHIVLPGDGSFPTGMSRLSENGLGEAIADAVHRGLDAFTQDWVRFRNSVDRLLDGTEGEGDEHIGHRSPRG